MVCVCGQYGCLSGPRTEPNQIKSTNPIISRPMPRRSKPVLRNPYYAFTPLIRSFTARSMSAVPKWSSTATSSTPTSPLHCFG